MKMLSINCCSTRSLLFLVASILSAPKIRIANAQDYTCDAIADQSSACPGLYNGLCESRHAFQDGVSTIPECENGDCYDCNVLCKQFDYDCYGCLNAVGCYYCPGDATCNNSPYYIFEDKAASCTVENDYIVDGSVCGQPTDLYGDPLYQAQIWVYGMINLEAVWERGYRGEGVHIRINDDGVDVQNMEFDGRFDVDNSCTDYLPDPNDSDGHGTAVAGIAVGNADNDHCAVGIAPMATFSACNVMTGGIRSDALAEKIEVVDVSQNSFGVE
jgi:hypothetical protein